MEGISVPVSHPVVIAMEGIKAWKAEEFLDLGHKFFRDAGREEFAVLQFRKRMRSLPIRFMWLLDLLCDLQKR